MKPKVAKKKSAAAAAAIQDMSLDNFLDHMEDDDLAGDAAPPMKKKKKAKVVAEPVVAEEPKKLKKKKLKEGKKVAEAVNGKEGKVKKKKKKDKLVPEPEVEPEEEVEGSGMKDLEREHKKALDKLEVTDPELFAFLKKNDRKLLRFGTMKEDDDGDDDDEDDEEEEEDDDIDDDDEDGEGKVHELPDKLEVASDESDFDDDDEKGDDDEEEVVEPGKQTKITLRLVKKWTEQLTAVPLKNPEIIRTVCRAFNSVLVTVTGETNVIPAFKAEGSAIFNAVVQLCVLHLGNAIRSYLGIANSKGFKNLKKNKKFLKVRSCLRTYFTDLTNLLENVSSVHIMNVMLKHLHQFSSIMVCYPTITKPILKRLIIFWSTAEEQSVRVLAFLCILKITHGQMRQFLSDVLKNMYLAYVKNSKFVSPNTLPAINFMRRSLTEMFTLDLKISYHHVFLYVRQLAIHLRNAIILQKKESFQYIYNWQFVNSLKLWGDVLGATYASKTLEPLVYPLVSIIHGTIKLNPSAQYFPLRFHCCRMLIDLTIRTRVFIPILPFLIEVLSMPSFTEEHKKLSMKPINLTCLLRFSPANIQENAYKDAVLDQIYELTLEYLAHESYSLCFSDLAVFPLINLRNYCKSTKVYKYSRKLKTLTDKIVESSEHIEKLRKPPLGFRLNDIPAIQAWEAKRKAEGTPLLRFYEQFARENEKAKRRAASQSENVEDYELPTIKKPNKKSVKQDGPVVLFPSDDEDEDEDDSGNGPEVDSDSDGEVPPAKKQKKGKKEKVVKDKKKLKKQKQKKANGLEAEPEFPVEQADDGAEAVDILKDLKMDDWDD